MKGFRTAGLRKIKVYGASKTQAIGTKVVTVRSTTVKAPKVRTPKIKKW